MRETNFFGHNKSLQTNFEAILGDMTESPKDPNQRRSQAAYSQGNVSNRLVWLIVAFVVLAGVLIFQLWQLQVNRGAALALEGEYNTLSEKPVFAPRGSIVDRHGTRLAWSGTNGTTSDVVHDRSYATSSGVGHVVGYVNYPQKDDSGNYYRTEMTGLAGVEAGYNDYLQAKPGRKIFTTNAVGDVVSESVISQPKPGKDLQVTIDWRLQNKLYSLIENTAQERNYTGGAGVIMDVSSGELITAVSYPGFDANKVTDDQEYLNQLQSATSTPFLNRVSEGIFTPGSVVKPFVALGALHEGVVTPQTTIISTGQLRVQNPYDPDAYAIFPDWKAHGAVDLQEALAVSSNVYFYQIGGGFKKQAGLGIDNIVKYSQAFGLGEKTGIDGLSESLGVIPTPEWKEENFADSTWRLGDTYNTAIGQYGYQVTPLQMVRGVAGIARDGVLPTPTLKKGSNPDTITVSPAISPADYQVVKSGMRQAVTREEGTAHNLDVDFVDIAAKTGTAQRGGKKAGVNSWIAGFYPYQDPQYAFTVVMSDGDSDNVVGGLFVMRRMLDWMQTREIPYLPS